MFQDLKKTYSTLAQVTNRIIADEGKPRGDIGGWACTCKVLREGAMNY